MTQGNIGFLRKNKRKNGFGGVDQYQLGGLSWKAEEKFGVLFASSEGNLDVYW